MDIINVITVRNGSIDSIDSYRNSATQIRKAEEDFADSCRIHGAQENYIDSYIEEGYYNDNSGFEISIIWSNVGK